MYTTTSCFIDTQKSLSTSTRICDQWLQSLSFEFKRALSNEVRRLRSAYIIEGSSPFCHLMELCFSSLDKWAYNTGSFLAWVGVGRGLKMGFIWH